VQADPPPAVVGQYALHDRIAAGGMAAVHLGRALAPVSRTVAIKRLHPHMLAEPGAASMFAEEARISTRVHHPNVVPTIDVLSAENELLLVMEYVDGVSLAELNRLAKNGVDRAIAIGILVDMLHGLHAAHEAVNETGAPLGIVHRDVSPQNVLVGADGVARLVDFGVARAHGRAAATKDGTIKGKLAYMAPEQIRCEAVTRRTDVFAAGVVLWEAPGKRLFAADNEGATLEKILVGWVPPPSTLVADVSPALDELVLRALDATPARRFATAHDMAVALEAAFTRAPAAEIAAFVERVGASELARRRACVARIEAEDTIVEERTVTRSYEDVTMLLPPRAPSRPAHRGLLVATSFAAVAVFALAMRAQHVFEIRAAEAAPAVVEPALVVTSTTATAPPARVAPPPEPTEPAPRVVAPPPAKPPPRVSVKPRRETPPPAAKRPCVARWDAASKKTIYEGECE
jgi:serine/threonine-protein kinase